MALIELATPESGSHVLPFVPRDELMPYSANGAVFSAGWPRACLVRRMVVYPFVLTTNNGSNSWTIALTNSAGTILLSLSTAAIAPNSWVQLDSGIVSVAIASSHLPVFISITKTGAPGNLYLAPAVSVI